MPTGTFENWGPYLSYGQNAASEMIISWKSPKFTHQHWIKYGETEECLQIIEEKWIAPTQEHSITLTGLKANQKYYYRISREGDEEILYSFETGLSSETSTPFQFAVISDMHANSKNSIKKNFEIIKDCSPDHKFLCVTGDSIDDGSIQSHWNAFFEDAQEYITQKPIMNTTGNHDTNNEDKYCRYLRAWHHPFVDPQAGAYYLVEYANAVFFFIDSNNAGGWYPTPTDKQYEWLEENLEKYANQNKWIFLFMHHQIFSTGDFSCAHDMGELYRSLCQEYHIDAVFYGHDHHYECFWVDREMDYGGTLYFVAGGGATQQRIDYSIMSDRDGQTKYVWPGRSLHVRSMGVPPESPNIWKKSQGFRDDEIVGKYQLLGILEPNYIELQIDGDNMEVRCIGWQKQVYHQFKVKRTNTGRKFTENSEQKIYNIK